MKKARKIVLASLPKFKCYIICSFLFAFIIQLIALVPPLIMRNIIDTHIPASDLSSIFIAIIFFVSLPIAATFLSTYYNYLITVTARNSGWKLIIQAFERIIYQPIKYFDNNNSAEIAAYCKTEAMNYVMFWLFNIPRLIANALVGIVVYVLIFNESIFIALGLLLYIPLSILPSKAFGRMMEGHVKKIIENNAKANQLMSSTFKGIKFIKAMMLEKTQIEKAKALNEDTTKVWSRTSAIEHLQASWVDKFIDNIFTGIIFAVSAILIINHNATLGMLILLLNYSPLFFSSVKAVSNANFEFSKQIAQYDKFFEILIMEDEREQYSEKRKFVFNEKIKFEGVSFAYDENRNEILKNLNIELPKNKWIGIVGPSGVGKTTIFELILRFYDHNIGHITIDHVDIKNIGLNDLRKNITLVSQELFLLPGTLRENLIMIKPNISEQELEKVLKDVGLTEFVDNLPNGLDTDIGEDGTLVSGGEKQRICLAIGLLRESQILLLDEITASLDEETETLIRNNIKKLMKSHNLTVIAISHRTNFLDEADHMITLF